MRGKASRSGPGGEIGEAPPMADAARRFRGSAPIGGRDSGRQSVGTTVGKRTSPLRTAWWLVRRADVGSELSAAGGRGSEVSEWLRSKFPASAVRQRRNFGHRNRIIGPYGIGGSAPPAGDRKGRPYGGVTRGAGKEPPRHGFAVPAPFRQGGREDGGRIATTSLRTGLAMTPFTRGAVQHRRADRGVRPYG